MCSAICPLAIAPTMAPTLDSEPNAENCSAVSKYYSHARFFKRKKNLRDVG
jgi:hypothetical protein